MALTLANVAEFLRQNGYTVTENPTLNVQEDLEGDEYLLPSPETILSLSPMVLPTPFHWREGSLYHREFVIYQGPPVASLVQLKWNKQRDRAMKIPANQTFILNTEGDLFVVRWGKRIRGGAQAPELIQSNVAYLGLQDNNVVYMLHTGLIHIVGRIITFEADGILKVTRHSPVNFLVLTKCHKLYLVDCAKATLLSSTPITTLKDLSKPYGQIVARMDNQDTQIMLGGEEVPLMIFEEPRYGGGRSRWDPTYKTTMYAVFTKSGKLYTVSTDDRILNVDGSPREPMMRFQALMYLLVERSVF